MTKHEKISGSEIAKQNKFKQIGEQLILLQQTRVQIKKCKELGLSKTHI